MASPQDVDPTKTWEDPRIFAYLTEVGKENYVLALHPEEEDYQELKKAESSTDVLDPAVRDRLDRLRRGLGPYLWWRDEFQKNGALVGLWKPLLMVRSNITNNMLFGDMDTLIVLGKFLNDGIPAQSLAYGMSDRYIMGFCH
jgi:hypothetical protein